MDRYDSQEFHCKRLGHSVPFSYCRSAEEGKPCGQIMNCTFHAIEIGAWLKEHFSDEEISSILRPRQDRLSTILEQIERARNIGREKK